MSKLLEMTGAWRPNVQRHITYCSTFVLPSSSVTT